ncbi:MAG: hypothetical protein J2P36_15390, partial [Ktedonobacteraceae bacterium]|nr:hypothetical protein [Ktedonobacteraceae bacterium]
YLPTANFLLRRTAWQRIDGFSDLRFGEDVDFCRRLLHSGAQIHYLPYGVVYHDYRTTLQTFAETRIVYASSEATLQALHPEMRRVLLLPPVPASFAGLLILAACSLLMAPFSLFQPAFSLVSLFSSLAALLLTLITSHQRHNQVQAHGFRIASRTLLIATLRAHLSYTYHLCRHLTRYYTLPLVLLGLLFPPLLLLPSVLYAIVIGVDYTRLRPTMSLWHYILVALLDDCSYALGVLKGCLQRKTWKPLVPLLKKRLDA